MNDIATWTAIQLHCMDSCPHTLAICMFGAVIAIMPACVS